MHSVAHNQGQSTIILVDDHPIVLDALINAFALYYRNIKIISCRSTEEALSLFPNSFDIKLFILDFSLPFLAGFDAINAFVRLLPDIPILILSGNEDLNIAKKTIGLGAKAYISKSCSLDLLMSIVGSVITKKSLQKQIYLTSLPSKQHTMLEGLTERQRQVVEYLLKGCSNKEIANTLNLAEVTVKKHLSTLFKSSETRNRAQLVVRLKSLGFVSEKDIS